MCDEQLTAAHMPRQHMDRCDVCGEERLIVHTTTVPYGLSGDADLSLCADCAEPCPACDYGLPFNCTCKE